MQLYISGYRILLQSGKGCYSILDVLILVLVRLNFLDIPEVKGHKQEII